MYISVGYAADVLIECIHCRERGNCSNRILSGQLNGDFNSGGCFKVGHGHLARPDAAEVMTRSERGWSCG